jgi:uncharacterized protein YhaN
MVDIIEADASHEEAEQAREEVEVEETETFESEKTEKSTNEQPDDKEFQAMHKAKKHFEEETKRLKEELKLRASQPATGDPMEAVRLGKALAEHSEEEADIIITYAKGKFNNLKPTPEQIIQASKDPWVKDAIEAKREKVKSENKTPSPSSPSSLVRGKSPEDLEKMDTKNFAKFARDSMNGGRSGI